MSDFSTGLVPGGPGGGGADGKSAYELAIAAGFQGTVVEWLASLRGSTGASAYQSWVDAGHAGTLTDFFEAYRGYPGVPGDSAGGLGLRRSAFGTGMLNIASNARCGLDISSDGGRWSRTRHTVLREANGFRLVYGNWTTGNGIPAEDVTPNPIAVRASMELPAIANGSVKPQFRRNGSSVTYDDTITYVPGDTVSYNGSLYIKINSSIAGNGPTGSSWIPTYLIAVHFPGESANREVIVQPGQMVVSDLIGYETVMAQQLLYVQSWVTPITNGVRGSGQYPRNVQATTPNDTVESQPAGGSAPNDYTLVAPTTLAANDATSGSTFGPMAVLAYPKAGLAATPCIVLRGDSIANGSAGTDVNNLRLANDSDSGGWMFAAFADIPYVRLTRGSDSLSKWTPNGTSRRKALMDGGSHYVCEDGTNTIGQGLYGDYDALRLRFVQEWRQGTERGQKVWQSTCTNQTDSSDTPNKYVTVQNQTPSSPAFGPGGIKEQWNNWLRDGAPMTPAWVPVPTGTAPSANVIRCRYISDQPDANFTAGGATSREITGWSAAHPLVGIIDVAKAVTAPNGWAWQPINGAAVNIGIHPNVLGMSRMSAMVDHSKFVAA